MSVAGRRSGGIEVIVRRRNACGQEELNSKLGAWFRLYKSVNNTRSKEQPSKDSTRRRENFYLQ